MNTRTLLIVLALAVPGQADNSPEISKKFEDLKPLVATLAKADKLILHEGLPHQGNERELMEAEKKAKKTITVHGWPFYAEPLMLKEGDGKKLTEFLSNEKSFQRFRGEKKCGGFHPDYAIEWRVGKDSYFALICFGCSEAIVHGPEKGVRVDFGSGTKGDSPKEYLATLLKPYRKNRPEPKE